MGIIGKDEYEDSNRRKKPPAMVLTQAAAYIDSEGSIHIGKTFPRPGSDKSNPAYFLHVDINNTDARLAHWFFGHFGGYVYDLKIAGKAKIRQYRWAPSARTKNRFLHWVRPYLLLKQEQVDVAIAFQNLKDRIGPTGVRGHADAHIEAMDRYWQQIKELRTEAFYRSVHPQRLSEPTP